MKTKQDIPLHIKEGLERGLFKKTTKTDKFTKKKHVHYALTPKGKAQLQQESKDRKNNRMQKPSQTPNQDMTLEQAMKYCFKDEATMTDNGREERKFFSDKDAADTYSESLKDKWDDNLGLVYGPFTGVSLPKDHPSIWWEVSYDRK